MARLRVVSLAIGIASVGSACSPTDVPTTPPSDVAAVPSDDEAIEVSSMGDGEPEEIEPTRGADEGFVVTLGSQCSDTWKGAIVRGAGSEEREKAGRFEIPNASTRELRLVKGDALLLTSPHGGIMALQFDKLTPGYGARVEVTSTCSGVKQTVVPR